MLVIRLQRIGRKAYPIYRLAVQESHRHPTSGRVVAYIGSYNPHSKEAKVQVELAQKYLDNGAQPTPRVAKVLKDAGVKLPAWVKQFDASKAGTIKKADKLRKNQPKTEPVAEVEPEVETAEVEAVTEEATTEA